MPGGHGFLLRNHGHEESASPGAPPQHNRQCWHRTPTGLQTRELAVAEGRGARLLSARDAVAALPDATLMRVSYHEPLTVRAAASQQAEAVGSRVPGTEVVVEAQEGAWVRLSAEDPGRVDAGGGEGVAEQWLMANGAEIGLGTLLCEVLPAGADSDSLDGGISSNQAPLYCSGMCGTCCQSTSLAGSESDAESDHLSDRGTEDFEMF